MDVPSPLDPLNSKYDICQKSLPIIFSEELNKLGLPRLTVSYNDKRDIDF